MKFCVDSTTCCRQSAHDTSIRHHHNTPSFRFWMDSRPILWTDIHRRNRNKCLPYFCCLQRLDFKRYYDLKRLLFLKTVQSSSNSVIKCVCCHSSFAQALLLFCYVNTMCAWTGTLHYWDILLIMYTVNLLVSHNFVVQFISVLSIYLTLSFYFTVVSL